MSDSHAADPTVSPRLWRTRTAEVVAGSELRPGDRVLIEAVVTEINEHGHAIVAGPELDGPWNVGDHFLWTGADDANRVVRARGVR